MADRRKSFDRTRRAVTTGRPMIEGVEAEGFLSDLLTYLRVPGLDPASVRFEKRADSRFRFEGTARLRDEPARVARQLVNEWLREIAVKGAEAHLAEVRDDAVVFEFVTWDDRRGCASGRLTAVGNPAVMAADR
jgi:hypothetical protein